MERKEKIEFFKWMQYCEQSHGGRNLREFKELRIYMSTWHSVYVYIYGKDFTHTLPLPHPGFT